MSNQLQPPEERGGGLILWLLGSAVVAVGLLIWIGSMG